MAKGDYKRKLRHEIIELQRVYVAFPDGKPFDELKDCVDLLINKRIHKLWLFSLMRGENANQKTTT